MVSEQYFNVGPTVYGGRGCFAVKPIQSGTVIHTARTPFTWTIFRDFRKEVCAYCFDYDLGRQWKVKIPAAGVWFCNEDCRQKWVQQEDHDGELVKVFEKIESTVSMARRKLQNQHRQVQEGEDEDFVPDDFEVSNEDVEELWQEMDRRACDLGLGQRLRVQALEDLEYDIARLVAAAVVRQANSGADQQQQEENDEFSWDKFALLESHELDLIKRMPALLEAHVRVFLFLKLVMTDRKYKPFVTTATVRSVVGKEAANAFGIWQLPLTMESECLGSAVYPSGSYFNHSCEPGVRKERVGREMRFITTRDVSAGEELCISYGMMLDMPVHDRRKLLREQWYFECGCARCQA
ncbi:hypothetical protein V1514DRAFT_12553 [Lipomyces japonicus]|uniref:uncharacterized protein n=1 Tax=Lipomyces japonicus TaxID=56871 RepID=UPI0034CE6A12